MDLQDAPCGLLYIWREKLRLVTVLLLPFGLPGWLPVLPSLLPDLPHPSVPASLSLRLLPSSSIDNPFSVVEQHDD